MLKNRKIRILLIEDEDFDVHRVENTIRPVQDQVKIKDVVSSGQAALKLLRDNPDNYDVIIMDFQLAGGWRGEKLIRAIKELDSSLQIIIITKMTINMTDFDFANRLLEAGAMWYCTKYPGDIEEYIYQPTDFILSIFNAFEKKQLERDRKNSRRKLNQNIHEILENKKIIGESESIQTLRELINKSANTDTTILIRGASGTGKELVAAHIHYLSKRKYEKFVPINCGSLPHELIESELFGYEKGSFTGAQNKKLGLFEVADKGTIFLDEIAELSPRAQSKLLRVIQERELDKIGRTGKIKVDVRVIAATNKNLEDAVKQGRFREDLYYRINVFPIWVPSLEQRKEDIPILVNYFLDRFSKEMGQEKPTVDDKALQVLMNYPWPGNVRELENIIQRLLISFNQHISKEDVEAALGLPGLNPFNSHNNLITFDPQKIIPWREMEQNMRKQYFLFVRKHSQSDAEAARKLGLAPPNFYRMCKELGIK